MMMIFQQKTNQQQKNKQTNQQKIQNVLCV